MGESRRKKQREGLPLLLPSAWPPPTQENMETIDAAMELFRELSSELLLYLHAIQGDLHFWNVRAQGSDRKRMRYMLLERGPRAFAEGVLCMFRAWMEERSFTQKLIYDASCRISERVTMLVELQRQLAILLAQVHEEVHKLGTGVVDRKTLCSALFNVYTSMKGLKKVYALPQDGFYGRDAYEETKACFQMSELPEGLSPKTEWTDWEVEAVINCLYENVGNLKQSMKLLMPLYERPTRLRRHWLKYSAGGFVVLLVTGWIVKHSRLAGSDDFEIWMQQGVEAVTVFLKEHVEEPVVAIRDDLFETFRKRHQGASELTDVRITAESLSRMLKAFAEQTNGTLPPNPTEQQLLELLMNRYEKELSHPIKNLMGGELARALLIQVQKLKLDIETAMLELNQILRANEINFAILAAFPALLFAILVAYVIRMLLSEGKGAAGRGREARQARRMLVAEAERALMRRQAFLEEGETANALWQYGMVVYALDRLYRVLSSNGISATEWFSMREDILELAKPRLSTHDKLVITARMTRVYDCIVAAPQSK